MKNHQSTLNSCHNHVMLNLNDGGGRMIMIILLHINVHYHVMTTILDGKLKKTTTHFRLIKLMKNGNDEEKVSKPTHHDSLLNNLNFYN